MGRLAHGFALLGLIGAISFFAARQWPAAGFLLLAAAAFIALGAHWTGEHRRSLGILLSVGAQGLVLWPGTRDERRLAWSEIIEAEHLYDAHLQQHWVRFHTIDNRSLGAQFLGIVPLPLSLPADARESDGTTLAEALPALRRRLDLAARSV